VPKGHSESAPQSPTCDCLSLTQSGQGHCHAAVQASEQVSPGIEAGGQGLSQGY